MEKRLEEKRKFERILMMKPICKRRSLLKRLSRFVCRSFINSCSNEKLILLLLFVCDFPIRKSIKCHNSTAKSFYHFQNIENINKRKQKKLHLFIKILRGQRPFRYRQLQWLNNVRCCCPLKRIQSFTLLTRMSHIAMLTTSCVPTEHTHSNSNIVCTRFLVAFVQCEPAATVLSVCCATKR